MQFNFVELEQARIHNVSSLSGVLGSQHKGAITLLTTDNLPYYWDGDEWKVLASSFLELSDTDPTSYTGTRGQFVHVNSTPNGLQFTDRMYAYGSNAAIEIRWNSGDSLPTLSVGSTGFSNNQTAILARSYSGAALDVLSSSTGGSVHTVHAANTGGSSGSAAIYATTQSTGTPAIFGIGLGVAGYGVRGDGATAGLYGYSGTSTGIRAEGVTYGFYGTASGASARGLSVTANGASAYAVEGIGGARGASFSGSAHGVYSVSGAGVGGYFSGSTYGVQALVAGASGSIYGVSGTVSSGGTTSYGVYGAASSGTTSYGGFFTSSSSGTTSYGIYASATLGTTRYAGYFESAQFGVYARTTTASQTAIYADASALNSIGLHAVSAGNVSTRPTIYADNTGNPSGSNVAHAIYARITTATNLESAAAILDVTSTDNTLNAAYALIARSRNSVASFTANIGSSSSSAVTATHKDGTVFLAKLVGSTGTAGVAFKYDNAQDGGTTNTRGIFCVNSSSTLSTAYFKNSNTSGTALLVEGGGTGYGIQINAGQIGLWNTKRTLLDQQVRFTAAGFAAVNGNQDNIGIPDSVFIRVTGPTAAFTIRGIGNGIDGRYIILANRSAFAMTLANQNANSTAANRIITGTGADVVIAADATAALVYDDTTDRWLLLR
jgi:hypothetical protein